MLKKLNLVADKENQLSLRDFEIIHTSNKKGALGVGSFATVKLAMHKKSKRHFALKTVRPGHPTTMLTLSQINVGGKVSAVDRENLRREGLLRVCLTFSLFPKQMISAWYTMDRLVV